MKLNLIKSSAFVAQLRELLPIASFWTGIFYFDIFKGIAVWDPNPVCVCFYIDFVQLFFLAVNIF
jgi:hypothetical protein